MKADVCSIRSQRTPVVEQAVAGKRYNSITIPLDDVPSIFYDKVSRLHGPVDYPAPAYVPSAQAGGGVTPPDSISLDDEGSIIAPPTAISRDVPPTVISKDIPPIVPSKDVPPAGFPRVQPTMPPSPNEPTRSAAPVNDEDLVEQLLDRVEKQATERKASRKQQAAKIKELQRAMADLKRLHAATLAKAVEKEKKESEFEREQQLKRLESALRQKEREVKRWEKQHQLDTDRYIYTKET